METIFPASETLYEPAELKILGLFVREVFSFPRIKKYQLNAVKCLGVFAGFNEAMGKKAEADNYLSQKSLNAARSVDKQCKYRKTPNVSARDELKFAATNTKMMMINKDMKNLKLTLDTCKKVMRYTYAMQGI
jgi:hypothetical protein